MSAFGKFIKELRTRKGVTLRAFCRLADLDPSNWSKVERGILPPPRSSKGLADIAGALLIEKGSEDWDRMFDLAAVGQVPRDLLSSPASEERITVFFRAARSNKPPTAKQVKEIIEAFKGKKM